MLVFLRRGKYKEHRWQDVRLAQHVLAGLAYSHSIPSFIALSDKPSRVSQTR